MSLEISIAWELTRIILEYFGLNKGAYEQIQKLFYFGKTIANNTTMNDRQKFICTLAQGIEIYLHNEHAENLGEMLKYTFENHFELQEFIDCFSDHEKFCQSLIHKSFSEIDKKDENMYLAFKNALKNIVEAIYENLSLFDIENQKSLTALKKLFCIENMLKLYGDILEDNNFFLHYKNTFAHFMANTTLPESSINRFHYMNPYIKFEGREEEINDILMFFRQKKRFESDIHIWGIAGPSGIGKSKLARHVADMCKNTHGVVWLTKNDFDKLLKIDFGDVEITYDKPILFVCDYANVWEKQLVDLIIHMTKSRLRVFFLLIERSENWFVNFRKSNYIIEKYTIPYDVPLNLLEKTLSREDYNNILDGFEKNVIYNGKKIDKDKVIAYTEKLGKNNRCLFLLMSADAYLRNDLPERWTSRDLMENYIMRSKRLFIDKHHCSEELCNGAYRMLALATALAGVNAEYDYTKTIQEDIEHIYPNRTKFIQIVEDLSETRVNDIKIPPLQPDIIGEFLFLMEFANLNKKRRLEWFEVLLKNDFFEVFLHRCLKDWCFEPEVKSLITYMAEVDAIRTANILCDIVMDIYDHIITEKILDLLNEVYKSNPCAKIAVPYSRAICHFSEFADKVQRESLLKKLLTIIHTSDEGKNVDVASIYCNIGKIYNEIGIPNRSINFYNKALTIFKKVLGTIPPNTAAMIYNNIAGAYYASGKYETAIEYYNMALNICITVYNLDHIVVATIYNNLGDAYRANGEYDTAIIFAKKSLDIYAKVFDGEHRSIATAYNNIGLAYNNKGDFDKAIEYYKKALTIYEKICGKEHSLTATTYNNIGCSFKNKGNYDTAIEYYKKDLSICKKCFGDEHPNVACSYNNIGSLYYTKGDYNTAIEYFKKDLAICEKVLGIDHPNTAHAYSNFGVIYLEKKNYAKAIDFFIEALNIYISRLGMFHPKTQETIKIIAFIKTFLTNPHIEG